ncbi:MAG: class IIb bacteriocin, lactobin A/cerein 7B family [Planctomycetaceae bacterium]
MSANMNNIPGFCEVSENELNAVEGGIWPLIGRIVLTVALMAARQGFSRASHNGGGSTDGPSCPVE